ncbi:hypothetical protein J6590_005607 [Homalodisca vitripennis]|nr:hypothetical protein J6590_005607 [Homalodisca vitripennis]
MAFRGIKMWRTTYEMYTGVYKSGVVVTKSIINNSVFRDQNWIYMRSPSLDVPLEKFESANVRELLDDVQSRGRDQTYNFSSENETIVLGQKRSTRADPEDEEALVPPMKPICQIQVVVAMMLITKACSLLPRMLKTSDAPHLYPGDLRVTVVTMMMMMMMMMAKTYSLPPRSRMLKPVYQTADVPLLYPGDLTVTVVTVTHLSLMYRYTPQLVSTSPNWYSLHS